MNKIILQTKELTIGYKQGGVTRTVADGLNVPLQKGELVCLLGPNGAGKSTLLRTVAGMQRPLHGTVFLGAANIHKLDARTLARQISVVLTERVQVGMLTAYALVALGRHPYTSWTGQLTAVDEAVVQGALTAVSAAHLAPRFVHELSDGERQKVMIARALAQEPQIMLLDEPTAFLDLPRRVEIMGILRRLAHEQQRAILLSTHDLDLALRTADTIWLMPENGPLQVGAPEDLVLSGAFERTFYSAGIVFDAHTGSFAIRRPQTGHIDLVGEGLAAIWARRALEREGFQVHQGPNGSGVQVRVVNGDGESEAAAGRTHWQLTQNNQTTQVDSIQSLLAKLQS
ncbi:MAG: ABC transporter ATP-binding protein [Anaerolineae bacterium]|nr:ABC transporter ATP-binding protein [Anaerolineae bacterium]